MKNTLEKLFIPFIGLQIFATETDTTKSEKLSPEMKVYYEDRLLDEAEPLLVHDQFGDPYPIPKGEGKTIEFRRFNALPKSLTALEEGVTPDGQNMSVENLTATVSQYGGWVQSSDLLEMTAIDPILEQRTKVLGSQAGRTLDTITREIINAGTNVIFAPKVENGTETEITTRADLTEKCNLTIDTFFQAQAMLKAQNAKPFGDKFVGIIHPYNSYQVMSYPGWIDIQKYSNTEKIYNGEIGAIGGTRFVETSEAKVFLPGVIFKDKNKGDIRRLTVKTAASATQDVIVNGEFESQTFDHAISVYIGGASGVVDKITKGSGQSTLHFLAAQTCNAGTTVCGTGAGKNGDAVFSTLIIAQNAYGVTELSGGGLEHIVKQLGYGDDPLNQRSSSGWKATKTAEILNDAYMVRIESVVDRYSKKISSN